MVAAFDTTGCGIDAPEAIDDFALISDCRIADLVPPIFEPDDLDFFIPTDFAQGSFGVPCPDVNLEVGEVTTADPGTEAEVVIEEIPVPGSLGCTKSFRFDFTIPKGERGSTGPRGSTGSRGPRGSDGQNGSDGPCAVIDITANVAIVGYGEEGSVNVVPGGSECAPSFRFDFILPRGEPGEDGSDGPPGPPGDDGITTVITDCADAAGSVEIGPFVTSAALSSNGFDRIYLDLTSKPITVNLSECGVISLVEGDTIFERQQTRLDMSQICRQCCEYDCGGSSSSDDNNCGICVFAITIGAVEYELEVLNPGLTWVSTDGLVFLHAPGHGVCDGEWVVEQYSDAILQCTWFGEWDGNSCTVLFLDGPTSASCPDFGVFICCQDGPPGSGGGSSSGGGGPGITFDCACDGGVPSPVYFKPHSILGTDCLCSFTGDSYELVEIEPGTWGWSGTLCGEPFSIEIVCLSSGPDLYADLFYEIVWDVNGGAAINGFIGDNRSVPGTCEPFFVETNHEMSALPCDMGFGTFRFHLHS